VLALWGCEVRITATVQIATASGQVVYFSRNFDDSRPISNIISWAENMGVKNPTINDIIFSDFTGESV
jgi:hypothetical protein